MSRINLQMKVDGVSSPWRLRKAEKKAYGNPKKDFHGRHGKRESITENEKKEQPPGYENVNRHDLNRGERNEPGKHIDIVA